MAQELAGVPSLSPIRVAPGGRYFETFDQQPFLFIGPNDALSWPGLAGLYRRKDLDAVDAYLADLAAGGVTILRLMLEYAHRDHRYFERPAGRFVPAMVRLWDDLFARCERHGLRVLLAPWDNFWMARRWGRHPYNTVNGGPAHGPGAFFTDEAVLRATAERLRFVVERWGGSGVLAAWDLFNEIHPYWGGTPQEQADAIARLSDAVRAAEQKAWGFTRPQTVSIFGPDPGASGYEELIFRHPCLDFASTHVYHTGAIDHPVDTVVPARSMAHWVRHGLARTPPGRPFTDSEHGPIHLFNDHRKFLPEPFDDEYERHLMWAHLASGGAGSGMRWPARDPHLLTAGMRQALGSLAGFARHVDWRFFRPRDAVADVEVGAPGVDVFAVRDDRQAVVWLLRGGQEGHRGPLPARAPLRGVPVTLRGLAAADAYCVQMWDTRAGRSLGCIHARPDAGSALSVTLPALDNDIALAVGPCDAAEAPPAL
jgi:mannan endo-1,4-beta-mannosidase